MSDTEFMLKYLHPFGGVQFWRDDTGFIVWRMGTGNNCELLHIRANEARKGHGRALLYRMLDALKDTPPYHSVYGFTRGRALPFYAALGFAVRCISPWACALTSIYKEGDTHLFFQTFDWLLEERREYEEERAAKVLPVQQRGDARPPDHVQ